MLVTTCIERPPLCCSYFIYFFFSLTAMYITPTQPPCIAYTKMVVGRQMCYKWNHHVSRNVQPFILSLWPWTPIYWLWFLRLRYTLRYCKPVVCHFYDLGLCFAYSITIKYVLYLNFLLGNIKFKFYHGNRSFPISNIKNCEPKIRPWKNYESYLTTLKFEGHHLWGRDKKDW